MATRKVVDLDARRRAATKPKTTARALLDKLEAGTATKSETLALRAMMGSELVRRKIERGELRAFTDDERTAARARSLELRHQARDLELLAGMIEGPPELDVLGAWMHALAGSEVDVSDLVKKWELRATPRQASKAFQLALEAARSFLFHDESQNPARWERIEKAHAVLVGADGDQGKRRAVLRVLRNAVEKWNLRDPASQAVLEETAGLKDYDELAEKSGKIFRVNMSERTREELRRLTVTNAIDDLVRVDSRFEELDAEFFKRLLSKTKAPHEVRTGGAGNTSIALLAARVAVRVRAFDDGAEESSKKRFLSAQRSATR